MFIKQITFKFRTNTSRAPSAAWLEQTRVSYSLFHQCRWFYVMKANGTK